MTGSAPPAWLFGDNSTPAAIDTSSGPPNKTVMAATKDKKAAKPAPAPESHPPAQLLDLVEAFLEEYSSKKSHVEFKKHRAKKGFPPRAPGPAIATSLLTVFQEWEAAQNGRASAIDDSSSSSSSSSESSSSGSESESESESESDSDGESDSESESESEGAENADVDMMDIEADEADSESSDSEEDKKARKAKKTAEKSQAMRPLKRKAPSSSSSSSSDSSDSSSEDERPQIKKQKTAKAASPPSSSSSSSSSSSEVESKADSDSDSSSSSSSSSSDSGSGSGSDSDSGAEAQAAASKVPLPGSDSDSDSDSSSSSDSSDDDSSAPGTQVKKEAKEAAAAKNGSDSSVTLGKTSPQVFPVSQFASLPPDPAVKANNRGKKNGDGPKAPNVPFSRIRKDIAIDPRLQSNAFNPADEWGQKAHEDLIVTKGKGFTKEKNKKKKGSYRGGRIDTNARNGIKFDD